MEGVLALVVDARDPEAELTRALEAGGEGKERLGVGIALVAAFGLVGIDRGSAAPLVGIAVKDHLALHRGPVVVVDQHGKAAVAPILPSIGGDRMAAAAVLQVAHHGWQHGTTLRFLQDVRPQVRRTDECGDVEIVTDGGHCGQTGRLTALKAHLRV